MNPLETRALPSRIALWTLLAIAIVLYGFPFVYLLFTSFKTPLDTIAVPPTVMPEVWTLENYVSALSRSGVLASLVNSVDDRGDHHDALARARGARRVRDHPVPHPERPRLHRRGPRDPHGAARSPSAPRSSR